MQSTGLKIPALVVYIFVAISRKIPRHLKMAVLFLDIATFLVKHECTHFICSIVQVKLSRRKSSFRLVQSVEFSACQAGDRGYEFKPKMGIMVGEIF